MVLSSPSSLGKWFHWQELRIRKMTPSSIFRWSTRLRPFALGGSNSKITGSIRSHRSSGISRIVGRVSLFPIIHHHPSFPQLYPTAYVLSLSDQSYFEIVLRPSRQKPRLFHWLLSPPFGLFRVDVVRQPVGNGIVVDANLDHTCEVVEPVGAEAARNQPAIEAL